MPTSLFGTQGENVERVRFNRFPSRPIPSTPHFSLSLLFSLALSSSYKLSALVSASTINAAHAANKTQLCCFSLWSGFAMLYTFPLSPFRSLCVVFTVVIGIACVCRLSSLSNKLFRVASHIISVEFHFLPLDIFTRSIWLFTDTFGVSLWLCRMYVPLLNATTLAAAAAAHRSIGIQWKCISLMPLPCGLLTRNFITHETRVSSYSQSHHENRVSPDSTFILSLSLSILTLFGMRCNTATIFLLCIHLHTHRPNILMDYYLHPSSWRSRSLVCPLHSILFLSIHFSCSILIAS